MRFTRALAFTPVLTSVVNQLPWTRGPARLLDGDLIELTNPAPYTLSSDGAWRALAMLQSCQSAADLVRFVSRYGLLYEPAGGRESVGFGLARARDLRSLIHVLSACWAYQRDRRTGWPQLEEAGAEFVQFDEPLPTRARVTAYTEAFRNRLTRRLNTYGVTCVIGPATPRQPLDVRLGLQAQTLVAMCYAVLVQRACSNTPVTVCASCGRVIDQTKRADATYCSPQCRLKAWRARRGAASEDGGR